MGYNRKEGIRTHPEVTGDILHLFYEVGSQLLDTGQVVLHGEGQIHQVVQVYGVVLHTFELHLKALRFTYTWDMKHQKHNTKAWRRL